MIELTGKSKFSEEGSSSPVILMRESVLSVKHSKWGPKIFLLLPNSRFCIFTCQTWAAKKKKKMTQIIGLNAQILPKIELSPFLPFNKQKIKRNSFRIWPFEEQAGIGLFPVLRDLEFCHDEIFLPKISMNNVSTEQVWAIFL